MVWPGFHTTLMLVAPPPGFGSPVLARLTQLSSIRSLICCCSESNAVSTNAS